MSDALLSLTKELSGLGCNRLLHLSSPWLSKSRLREGIPSI